jgi:radical SAM-linked protein
MRLRIGFAKVGKIRWTSHRDVARMWERAFRRVELPVAYTAGFSPRPKVSFGLALPTGHESVAEYLDVELTEPVSVDVTTLPQRLSAALPLGVDAVAVEQIPPGTPSLQEDVQSCSWRWVAAPHEGSVPPGTALDSWEAVLAGRVAAVLAASSVVVTRTRKGEQSTDDIRAGILNLHLIGPAGFDPSDGVWLEAELACRPRALRPAEVLTALDANLEERQVRRIHQWTLRDGARSEPMARSGATGAPHAFERAS